MAGGCCSPADLEECTRSRVLPCGTTCSGRAGPGPCCQGSKADGLQTRAGEAGAGSCWGQWVGRHLCTVPLLKIS